MLLSKYFLPILRDNPKESSIISHTLMLKSGMIRQTGSGIYTWLPLGLRVLDKISNIIKQEMNNAGALNCLMPTIQTADIWMQSGRYEDYGLEMLRIKDRHNREMLYGPTNEEQITQIFSDNVKSYKDLPLNLYQVQWKFRDEIRPRFGVMRGREFLMKDAYSFDLTPQNAKLSYKKMFVAYLNIFKTMGLSAIPMQADTGPIGGDLSHEFMILAHTGESEVFYDDEILNLTLKSHIDYENDIDEVYNNYTSLYSSTQEKHNISDTLYLNPRGSIQSSRGIEVGHIFYFADKYTKSFKSNILDENGNRANILMGSYGIGVSRLVGAIIEASHDSNGIIWPSAVSPFDVILNCLSNSPQVRDACDNLYKELLSKGIDVLYNDRDENPGSKLATADLIGVSHQLNIGNNSLKQGMVEIKNRKTLLVKSIDINDVSGIIKSIRD